jgi:hypothetical protein
VFETQRPLTRTLAWLGIAVLIFYFFHNRHFPGAPDDTRAFLGRWTEEKGEPGNYIQFGLVTVSEPGAWIELQEGRATFHKQLGEERTTVVWNFGNTRPLVVNVTVDGKCHFAAVHMTGDNHMLIRFTDDWNTAESADVFDSPEVKRMTRVVDRPAEER